MSPKPPVAPAGSPLSAPPPAPTPWLAQVLSPPGPPPARLLSHGADGVMAVPGRYCVTYLLLGAEDVAVVDCGSAEDVARVERALAWLGRPASQVRYVIPTHLHFDHVMGVDCLARRLGVPVALGRTAAAHVERGHPLRFPGRLRALRALPTWPMQGMPVFTRTDWRRGLGFGFPWSKNRFRSPVTHLPGHGHPLPGSEGGLGRWTVLETPGHADDAICLHHAEAGWLVAGDTLRNFLGGEWNPLVCDAPRYERTRGLLQSRRVTTVLPGHGPIFEVPGGLATLGSRPWWLP
ncbi:MAG: MBL fold metallo-hydrolase [bacterium]